jgi:hypothetical protein
MRGELPGGLRPSLRYHLAAVRAVFTEAQPDRSSDVTRNGVGNGAFERGSTIGSIIA